MQEITKEQQAKINELRDYWFNCAISTTPCNRLEVVELVSKYWELCGVEQPREIIWVDNPQDGNNIYNELRDSLNAVLWRSSWESLCESLGDPHGDSIEKSLEDYLRETLWYFLSHSQWAVLWDFLKDSLRTSLKPSYRTNHNTEGSFWDYWWNSPILAFYQGGEILGVEYPKDVKEKFDIVCQIVQSTFAVWVTPDKVIICDKHTWD